MNVLLAAKRAEKAVALVVGAVEVRSRQDDGKAHKRRVYAGRLRLRVVPDRNAEMLVFSNMKTWIKGTHHGRIEPKHLQAYLNEYVFRFNRRFYPMTAFHSVLGIAARCVPLTYEQLYSGKWEHAA